MTISAMTGVKYDDICINECFSYTDHEGARRCSITGMLVGSGCSLHCGTSTICFEREVHEGVVVVKFMG